MSHSPPSLMHASEVLYLACDDAFILVKKSLSETRIFSENNVKNRKKKRRSKKGKNTGLKADKTQKCMEPAEDADSSNSWSDFSDDGHSSGAAAVLQPARQGGGQQRQQRNEGQGRDAHSSLKVSKDSKSTVLKCR